MNERPHNNFKIFLTPNLCPITIIASTCSNKFVINLVRQAMGEEKQQFWSKITTIRIFLLKDIKDPIKYLFQAKKTQKTKNPHTTEHNSSITKDLNSSCNSKVLTCTLK